METKHGNYGNGHSESWKLRDSNTLPRQEYELVQLAAEGYDNAVIGELLSYNAVGISHILNRIAVRKLQMPEGYVARAYIAKLYWQGKILCKETT